MEANEGDESLQLMFISASILPIPGPTGQPIPVPTGIYRVDLSAEGVETLLDRLNEEKGKLKKHVDLGDFVVAQPGAERDLAARLKGVTGGN